MQRIETRGLVLYNRNFREDDKLVKIFTEQAGKRMFFVKHASKSKLIAGIQPLSFADFIVKINEDGLSYIDDAHQIKTFQQIHQDIFQLAYASYIVSLADACMNDGIQDAALFAFLEKTLELMESGLDAAVLTNIFEIQLLSRFGVSLNFHECAVCHRVGLPFDYSYRFSGVLCPQHLHEDERRSHVDPNVLYLLDQFQSISFTDLETISIKSEMKQKIRLFIDQLYDEYVGIHLKSKKFIDDLDKWGDIMKK
ncbi:DNA repair protein RecO [Streptococcus cameli]